MNAVDESLPLRNWTQSAGEEVANGISHGIGLVGAIIGTPILLLAAFHHGDVPFLIGTIIFTTTMLFVYLASTLYHGWPQTDTKSLLQVIDHAAIFLLIAGTYTPFALGPLRGGGGLAMLGIVWALAFFGVIMKATRGVLRHRRLAMTLYLGIGLDRTHVDTSARADNSVVGAPLVDRGWHRLHGRHFIFRERAAALWPFHLASVRACRQ